MDRVDLRFVHTFRALARGLERLHPTRFVGEAHLPPGGALLVGNHGLLGYETLLFFERIFTRTGRLPRGLADRWFYRVPPLSALIERLGGMLGSHDNARRTLDAGHLVVCYPGGAREVLKHDHASRYRLQWGKSLGFVRVALAAGVPIIPFAAAGVDHTFDVVRRLRGTGALLMGHDKYDLPLLSGYGGAPLPRPVPFWFEIGAPIDPVALGARLDDEGSIAAAHASIWGSAQAMLDDLVRRWTRRDADSVPGSASTPPPRAQGELAFAAPDAPCGAAPACGS